MRGTETIIGDGGTTCIEGWPDVSEGHGGLR